MCVCDMDNYIGVALFSTGRRSGLGARLPASPCSSVPFAPSPEGFSTGRRPKLVPGRRLMKDEKRCGKAHRPSRIAFLHLNSKAKRAEQRHGLRSALHIIIPKGKVMRGGPRALLLIISKKRIDDERPHRSPFVVNSFHLLPGRPLLARYLSALSTGSNPHAMRREKVANCFLTTFTTTFTTT